MKTLKELSREKQEAVTAQDRAGLAKLGASVKELARYDEQVEAQRERLPSEGDVIAGFLLGYGLGHRVEQYHNHISGRSPFADSEAVEQAALQTLIHYESLPVNIQTIIDDRPEFSGTLQRLERLRKELAKT